MFRVPLSFSTNREYFSKNAFRFIPQPKKPMQTTSGCQMYNIIVQTRLFIEHYIILNIHIYYTSLFNYPSFSFLEYLIWILDGIA